MTAICFCPVLCMAAHSNSRSLYFTPVVSIFNRGSIARSAKRRLFKPCVAVSKDSLRLPLKNVFPTNPTLHPHPTLLPSARNRSMLTQHLDDINFEIHVVSSAFLSHGPFAITEPLAHWACPASKDRESKICLVSDSG